MSVGTDHLHRDPLALRIYTIEDHIFAKYRFTDPLPPYAAQPLLFKSSGVRAIIRFGGAAGVVQTRSA